MVVAVSVFAVSLIIVLILVGVPIIFWTLQGMFRLLRRGRRRR